MTYTEIGTLVTARSSETGGYYMQRATTVVECETCGSVVSDTDRHDTWHSEQATR